MSQFAKNTSVSCEKSRTEIERTLMKYGADQFLYGSGVDHAVVGFRAHGRMIRFELSLPHKGENQFIFAGRRRRTPEAATISWEQDCRQRWRALALVVKAKLEAVESGITTFEQEFLAQIVLPDGGTFGKWAEPQLEAAYNGGSMPALLPGSTR